MNTLRISSSLSLFFTLTSTIMFSLQKQVFKLIRPSIIWNYVILIATHFKQVLNLLLHRSFPLESEHDMLDGSNQELGIRRYSCNSGCREETECAVCLCKIEEGEELRELRCDHLFHRVCLDRWVGYKRATCPLCRSSLLPWRRTADEHGVEVLFFKYCSSNSGDRQTWWLR
ncbi:hypothetical protein FH972_008798 [Carpinus fangiana]|uniref:RING-type domain-containing protein n=1 Tax=Carpinus fangiana TaxID=176857 RepID=A0A5N6QZW3_9ROSI|nr:hypothetical protein FH972_008798 [Carpinus fangiana]